MLDHERYQELSALAMIGQLSSIEDQDLNRHLQDCESCRQIHGDYSHIVHKLPQADVSRWRIRRCDSRPLPDPELRSRFFARARAEGVNFSFPAEQLAPRRSYRWNWTRNAIPSLALAALGIAAVWGISATHQSFTRLVIPAPLGSSRAADQQQIARLQAELARLGEVAKRQQQEIRQFNAEKARSEEMFAEMDKSRGQFNDRLYQLSTQLQRNVAETDRLQASLQQKESTLAGLRASNEDLDKRSTDNLGEMALQEARIQNLSHSLEQERENLEQERQLMAVSQDVRQLMGARNLHIIDVRDVNASENTDKAFGRVFYAEGQSMIFYAFDLSNGNPSPARYTFQAWGQRDGARSLRSLGMFEVDSREQHRWVLKVNDSSLVAGIDSVFVTAESLKDSKEPHGRKLLYAYLGGQPNHP
jgi:hypothetical protein